jgi:hypothetical protein
MQRKSFAWRPRYRGAELKAEYMQEQDNSFHLPPYERWEFHYGRGEIAKLSGDLVDAVAEFHLSGAVLWGETSDEMKLCQAQSLVSEGIVQLMRGMGGLALDAFLEARELRRGLIHDQHFLNAELLHHMGNARRFLGHYELAHEHFNEAWWCLVSVLPKTHPYVMSVAEHWMHSNVEWETVKRKNGGL